MIRVLGEGVDSQLISNVISGSQGKYLLFANLGDVYGNCAIDHAVKALEESRADIACLLGFLRDFKVPKLASRALDVKILLQGGEGAQVAPVLSPEETKGRILSSSSLYAGNKLYQRSFLQDRAFNPSSLASVAASLLDAEAIRPMNEALFEVGSKGSAGFGANSTDEAELRGDLECLSLHYKKLRSAEEYRKDFVNAVASWPFGLVWNRRRTMRMVVDAARWANACIDGGFEIRFVGWRMVLRRTRLFHLPCTDE